MVVMAHNDDELRRVQSENAKNAPRQGDGAANSAWFAERAHTGVEQGLPAGYNRIDGPYEPGQPVRATVEYHEYADQYDEDPKIITQDVDVAGVLDTLPLEDVTYLIEDQYADTDRIVYALQSAGSLIHPDMPFGVLQLDEGDLEAYEDWRKVNKRTAPIADRVRPNPIDLKAVIDARKKETARVAARLAAAREEEEAAETAAVKAIVGDQIPELAYLVLHKGHPKYQLEPFRMVKGQDGVEKEEWIDLGQDRENELWASIVAVVGEDSPVLGGRGTANLIDFRDDATS